jgi:uncharacterized protein YjiS (DUF1127 family)
MTSLTNDRFELGAARQALRPSARSGVGRRVAATLRTWRHRIEEREALARFSARDMKDIGIGQPEVMREITKPFWKA